ncbi:MAG: YlxR family protein [Oscillospiraceae bacterium]|nr:YlxR family protein [Oscillospiraceae bacterium]
MKDKDKKQNKILPIRMCCVCRKHKQKNELNKFVIKDNDIIFDKFYKEFGRGAYICKDVCCLKKLKNKSL